MARKNRKNTNHRHNRTPGYQRRTGPPRSGAPAYPRIYMPRFYAVAGAVLVPTFGTIVGHAWDRQAKWGNWRLEGHGETRI